MLEPLEGKPQLAPCVDRPDGTALAEVVQGDGKRGCGARIRFVADKCPVEIRAQQTNGHRIFVCKSTAAQPMKSAYELAMERLAEREPAVHLTPDQKKRIAETEAKCRADIAAKELLLRGEVEKARAAGETDQIAQLQRQLADEIRRCQEKRDREKAGIRSEAAS